jgi:hypothetical protein
LQGCIFQSMQGKENGDSATIINGV